MIIRRPHAYFLIDRLFEEQGGIRTGTPAGCLLENGSIAPLPGVYVLDADGKLEANSSVSRELLLELLEVQD